jgi:hypothetical protein
MTLNMIAAWLLSAEALPPAARSAELAELLSRSAEHIRVTKWNTTQAVKRGELDASSAEARLNDLLLDLGSVSAVELRGARDTLRAYLLSARVEASVARELEELLGPRAPLYAELHRIEANSPLLCARLVALR